MELKIENLSKSYGKEVQALKNVSLDISTGMFGLLGPNGAGKSTLMRTIATLQNADEGTVSLGGADVFFDVLKHKDEVRRILGYLPQEFGLYPEISAEEMLNHIALLKGMADRKERKKIVTHLLELTDLSSVRKRKLGGFSGGMKQRFGIAQALIGNPKLIIVDEPTAGLDPEQRNRFHNILSEVSENRIVILSTHIVDDVEVLCNKMAIIHEGNILLCEETRSAMKQLSDKVWEKVIRKDQTAEYDTKYSVILTRLSAGNILIHVESDSQPEEGFVQVTPDLEDVYFSAITNKIHASA